MIRFVFHLRYMNETWFTVTGDGEPYRVVYRHGISDYERSITTGGAERYARDCEPLVGFLRRHCGGRPLPRAVVLAYNAWCIAESDRANAHFDANPDKYPPHITAGLREPRHLAKGAAHWSDGGWAFDLVEEPMKEAA